VSDFKWADYRSAHVFAGGWSTASHKRKMTLLEAPTGTLFFYYKDNKQEIMHTLLLEKYGVSKLWGIVMKKPERQDKNAASTQAETSDLRLRIVTVPGAQEEARRNGVETETNKDKSSSCDVSVTSDEVLEFF